MPICIPDDLPAKETLESENISTIPAERASHQDIRPLRIAILNLMPTKIDTETQLLRLLGNSPLQVEIELVRTASYESRHTPKEHLSRFYTSFEEIKKKRYDGLIVTGAPVETMPFEQVLYWKELCDIFAWSEKNVFSTFNICWGAQAALYYFYGIDKQLLPRKLFGVYEHRLTAPNCPLVRGFDERFLAPHSRHTETPLSDVLAHPEITPLAVSDRAGLYIALARGGRQVFVTGHSEYDRDTLASEYFRDLERGLQTAKPEHYFPEDNELLPPLYTWRGHANLLYVNWLNFVYQETPFDLGTLL